MVGNENSNGNNLRSFRIVTVILAVFVCLSFMPLLSGEALAASKSPAKVKSLKVTVSAENKISVKWKKAKNATKYEVYIKDNTSSLVAKKKVKKVKYSFKGQGKTKYTIKVRGLNGKKKGKWTAKKKVTTNANAEEAAAKKDAEEASKKAKDAQAAADAAAQKAKDAQAAADTSAQKAKETAEELAKTAAAALNDHKDAAAAVLDLSADPKDYDDATWDEIEKIIDKAKADIEGAKDADEVDKILEAAEEEIAVLPTALDKAKEDAANELDKLVSAKSVQETIQGIVADAKIYLLFAENTTEVELIVAEAEAKVEAVKELGKLVNLEDYDEGIRDTVAGIIEDAQDDVRYAENLAEVQKILHDTKDAIELIPTTLDEYKENALEELGKYYDDQYDYEKGDWADVKDILEEAESSIILAETDGEVDAIVGEAEAAIELIPTKLETAQEKAIEELEAYYELEEAYTPENWLEIKDIIDNAIEAIEGAESVDEVEGILDTAEDAIDEFDTKLESAQADALDILWAFDEKDYDEDDWDKIETIINFAAVAIMQADYEAEVEDALANALDLIAEFPTIVESAQLEAIADLYDYAAMNEYDEDIQELVDDAVARGIEEINAATTEKEVQGALLAAEAEIDIYPTVLDGYKEEQLNLLRAHYDGYAGMEWMSETEWISMKQIQDRINEAAKEMIYAFDEDDVDEIIADAKDDINAMFKVAAMKELAEFTDDDYLGYYSEDNRETVMSIVSLATVTITEADSDNADVVITATVNHAEALIIMVPTILDEAKTDAIEALYAYAKPADYDPAEQEELTAALTDGVAAIMVVEDFVDLNKSLEEVNAALDAAKEEIDWIPTSLDKYKATALKALSDEYVYNEEYKDLSWETMQKIQTVIRNAAVAMGDEDVNTEAKVNVIVTDAEKQIADILKAPIAGMLEAYRLNKGLYTEQYWPAVELIIDLGVKAINAAENEGAMWEAFDKAEELIKHVPTKLDLYKSSAIYELYDFVDERDYDKEEWEEIFGEEGIIADATADIAAVEVDLEKYPTVAEAEAAAEAEVDGICAAAESLISAVDTKLDKYKAEQIEKLRAEYKNGEKYEDLEWSTMKQILAIIDEAEEALNDEEVADNDAVDAIIEEAKEKIAALLPNLEDYRQDALDDLDELLEGLNRDDYGEAEWANIQAAYNIGVGAIKFADSEEAIDDAFDDAESVIMAIPTVLDAYKIVAVAELDAYAGTFDENDYEEGDWGDFLDAVDDGEWYINNAADTAEVDAELADAKAELDAIPTSMDRLRESKVKELNDYVASVKGVYDEAGLGVINGIVEDAAEAIDATEDEDVMDGIVADAKEAIGDVKTALENAKEAAKTDLKDYADSYCEEYPDLEDALDEAVEDGEEAIDAARTINAVDAALEDAEAEIDAIVLEDQINAAVAAYEDYGLDKKEDVFAAVEAYEALEDDDPVKEKIDTDTVNALYDTLDDINDDWAASIDTAIEGLLDYGIYVDDVFTINVGQKDTLAEAFATVSGDYEDYLDVFEDEDRVSDYNKALLEAVETALSDQEPVEP